MSPDATGAREPGDADPTLEGVRVPVAAAADELLPATSRGSARAGHGIRARRRQRVPLSWALAVPVVGGAFVDLPRLWRVGPITALGALTVLGTVVGVVVLVAAARYPRALLRDLAPFAAFVLLAAASLLWAPAAPDALPVLLGYVLLGALVAAAGAATALRPDQTTRVIDRAVDVGDVVGLAIAAVSIAEHGLAVLTWPVHPRAIALVAIAPVSWRLAQWYDGRRWALVPAALWIVVVVASQSRMATGVMIVLPIVAAVLHAAARPAHRDGLRSRALLLGLLVSLAGTAAVVRPSRDRLFVDDRTEWWSGFVANAMTAPLVGQGVGSSVTSPVLRYWYARPPAADPRPHTWREYWWTHPHNEFLRAWYDLGLAGVVLLASVFGTWLRTLAIGWRRSGREPRVPARLSVAALLVLIGVLLAAQTDNPLVYPFVIAPVAVMVGAGLGAASHGDRGRRRRSRRPPAAAARPHG